MKAIILAGGKGKRLKGLHGGIPKVMLPVCGRPLLEHNLRYLKKQGIRDVIINLHYRPEMIRHFLKAKRNFGLRIHLSNEPRLLGTAGAVRKVRRQLGGQAFVVLYGDNLVDFNLKRMIRAHAHSRAIVTMGVYNPAESYWSGVAAGLVKQDAQGRILGFEERRSNQKIQGPQWVNGGLLIVSPQVFALMPRKKVCDFSKHVFPLLLRKKKHLQAVGGARYVLASDTTVAWKRTCRLARRLIRKS